MELTSSHMHLVPSTCLTQNKLLLERGHLSFVIHCLSIALGPAGFGKRWELTPCRVGEQAALPKESFTGRSV